MVSLLLSAISQIWHVVFFTAIQLEIFYDFHYDYLFNT